MRLRSRRLSDGCGSRRVPRLCAEAGRGRGSRPRPAARLWTDRASRGVPDRDRCRRSCAASGSIRDRSLIIGVDRIDYSKGLPARFAAYSHLLEHYPQTRGRTVLMQIASPSPSDVPEYRAIRRELEAAAGHINGRYAEFDWTPLRYLNKSFNHRILSGFYRAARIGLVTPFC